MKINKVSKKIIIMLSGIFLVSTNISAAENEDVLLQSIFNAHAVVFGVENVFSQELYFASWNEVFKKIAIFVNENSGGNKKLWKAFSTCQKVSETIRTIIKHARAVSAAPAPNLYPLERAESKNYQITITKNIQRLEEISKPNLEEQKNILENTTFYLSAAKKNSVKNLLLNLISVLEFTIDKVVNDYNRLWAESL